MIATTARRATSLTRVLRRSVILALGSALFAEQRGGTYADWSDDKILKLLVDSPWAKRRRIEITWTRRQEKPFTYKDVPGADPTPAPPSGSPVGGIGKPKSKLPDEAGIIVRWASALPVRQAVAVYRAREEKASAAQREEWVGTTPSEYIIEIIGVPSEVAHKGAESVAAILQNSMVLRTSTGRELKPTRARVTPKALTLEILVYFPKTKPIQLADKEVECTADVQLFQIREKFNLRSMVFEGRLEL